MSRVSELLRQARSTSALDDFGEDSFREGLERLVDAVDREARLSERGRIGFDLQVVDLLVNRLQVEHWYRLHPEIDEQQIVAPLIGLGLPRTGSTALSCLLAEDPQVRSIRNWEALMPCPPPETATEFSDPRIEIAQRLVLKRQQMFPRKMAMLPSSATMPTECQTYMGYDFKSHLFQALWQVPSYARWLNHDADLVPTYRYVKRVLKLLQWRCPPHRWRLKNPSHIVFIDALDEVFPDARYWMTHRDIGKVIPSVADLYHELIRASSDQVDKTYIGELSAHWCELGMRKLIAFRDAGNDSRFFDIHFVPFQKDPFTAIAKLYQFLGEPLGAEALERMQAWRRDTPRDQHGEHHYDAADFGIDLGQLRERFAFYTERFGIAVSS
ncbi:sulfotransferase family protein [Hydrocarboniphaga sp.]|uniref:sulfotransferase family protein n=1 Tax=Hydrocarboniphaga sp. TaxID=2033016 RepID=UPI003D0FC235